MFNKHRSLGACTCERLYSCEVSLSAQQTLSSPFQPPEENGGDMEEITASGLLSVQFHALFNILGK